jgi:hypothetical protein
MLTGSLSRELDDKRVKAVRQFVRRDTQRCAEAGNRTRST